ncbi:MAG: acetate--CoA ligase family protein [Spirochaetia bacterium]
MTNRIGTERLDSIEKIMEQAEFENRSMLFEHEVYQILSVMGLAVPVHRFVTQPEEITRDVLAGFGSGRIVMKAAAFGLGHKQKAGAIDVVIKDLNFVRYRFDLMKKRLGESGYQTAGILLVEMVDYSEELGNEILLGFRESEAFGPVISFSKGGSDAEHFAENFSSPNIILPPIDREWTEALLRSTKIHKKWLELGRDEYVGKIVNAGIAFSRLAAAFSGYMGEQTDYILDEFEVNPFVFDSRNRFLPLDGYAVFSRRKRKPPIKAMPAQGMDSFFNPRGVAVIGVSSKGGDRPGNIIARNLLHLGRDDVFFVNPKGGDVILEGKSCPLFTSVKDIPRQVDLAVITVPAEKSLEPVLECAEKGIKAVLLIPGGFSETGRNAELEEKILKTAGEKGIRVMGPNCLGIIYFSSGGQGINTFFIPENKFRVSQGKQKNTVVLSQSGALGITEIYNLRHAVSPKAIVSYGNQLDVDPSDLIEYFGSDPEVAVIGCYIEGFKTGAGRRFFETARRCDKPIIVYKAGRTKAGRHATESHTASIAGEYQVAKAAVKQAGLIIAESLIDHGDFLKTFATLDRFPVNGKRVAVIANAGYEKTYAADNLGGLEVAEFDEETKAALRRILPPFVGVDPLLDLTPMAGDEMYEECLDTVLSSDSVDGVVISITPQGGAIHTTDSEIREYHGNVAARIVKVIQQHKKPVTASICVSSGSDAMYNRFGQILDEGGVPTFLSADRAMICLNAFIRYRIIKQTGNLSEWLS